MLDSINDRAEGKTATTKTATFARLASVSQASEKRGELEGYTVFTQSDNWLLTELAIAERRVLEINTRVGRQRQIIKQLAGAGKDITSAEIMLDSLLVSLFLAAEDRHRLRAMLNTTAGKGCRS